MRLLSDQDTEVKVKFAGSPTLGGVLTALSLLVVLYTMFFVNLAMPIMVMMRASGVILTIGYGINVWQDYKRRRPFRGGLLFCFLFFAFVIVAVTPIMMASAIVSSRYR